MEAIGVDLKLYLAGWPRILGDLMGIPLGCETQLDYPKKNSLHFHEIYSISGLYKNLTIKSCCIKFIFTGNTPLVVVEPTPLKNMLVKMGIFPKVRGEQTQHIWVATTQPSWNHVIWGQESHRPNVTFGGCRFSFWVFWHPLNDDKWWWKKSKHQQSNTSEGWIWIDLIRLFKNIPKSKTDMNETDFLRWHFIIHNNSPNKINFKRLPTSVNWKPRWCW